MSERRWFNLLYCIIRPVMAVVYPTKYYGRENIPEEGCLICGNHSSGWDPFFIVFGLTRKRPITAMAKESIMKTPVVGFVLKKAGVFGVKRGASDIGAIKHALEALKNGKYVALFPEGTRIKSREEGDPKTGAAMLASRAGVQVLPVYIPMKKKLFRVNKVYFGKPMTLEHEGKRANSKDYERFTAELMDAIYGCGDGQ